MAYLNGKKILFAPTVILQEKQAITIEQDLPQEIATTVYGEDVILSVVATSPQGELSYQWYKNGKVMPNETKSFMNLGSNKNIEATYNVRITNVHENITTIVESSSCTVSVTDESIIVGETYTSNATESDWFTNRAKENVFDGNGRYLTDGKICHTYWTQGYFGVKKMEPEIVFNFSEVKPIKELQLFFIEDTKAGVLLPQNISIEYKSDENSVWNRIFHGKVTRFDFILTSQKTLDIKFLRIRSCYSNYTFISEVRAFSEPTGAIVCGELAEYSLISGLSPSAESTTIKYWANDRATDPIVLTDDKIYEDGDNYKNTNLTFYDDSASFVYEKSGMEFQEVQIAGHCPVVSGTQKSKSIKRIKIEAYINDAWKVIADNTFDLVTTTKIYTFTSNSVITADKIKITLYRFVKADNPSSTDWNGISISEISVFGEVHTVTPDGKMELK